MPSTSDRRDCHEDAAGRGNRSRCRRRRPAGDRFGRPAGSRASRFDLHICTGTHDVRRRIRGGGGSGRADQRRELPLRSGGAGDDDADPCDDDHGLSRHEPARRAADGIRKHHLGDDELRVGLCAPAERARLAADLAQSGGLRELRYTSRSVRNGSSLSPAEGPRAAGRDLCGCAGVEGVRAQRILPRSPVGHDLFKAPRFRIGSARPLPSRMKGLQ
jgi:hypothetical protein